MTAASLRTPCAPSLDQLVELLRSCRFNLTTEAHIQRDIDQLLVTELGPDGYRREHVLGPKDRPDFLVLPGLVVEVKHFRARPALILPQLARYAAHDLVEAVVLVTARAVGFGDEVGGKPLRIVATGAAWL